MAEDVSVYVRERERDVYMYAVVVLIVIVVVLLIEWTLREALQLYIRSCCFVCVFARLGPLIL